MEEVFVLRYTKERVITWLLCAKRLRVIKDVARHIAKVYLKEKTYHFAPSLGIACAPYQLQVYALITNGTYSIIDVAQKTNVEPCVAGIIALESRNKRVCVLCARPETETIVMDLVREMIGTNTIHQVQYAQYGDVETMRGSQFDLIVMLNVDECDVAFFYQTLVPMLQLANIKLLMFGNVWKSPLLSELCGKNVIENV